MKLSVIDQEQLIPDNAIKEAWLMRDDVQGMSEEKKEMEWKLHLDGVNRFRAWLSTLDNHIIAS